MHHQQKVPLIFVAYAETTGLFLDDYYKATENINAFNPTRADANALADALAEYVEVMDNDVYRGYLEKIREFGGGGKYSLSFEDEAPTRIRGGIYGEDVLLEDAPMKQTVVEIKYLRDPTKVPFLFIILQYILPTQQR